MLLLGNTELLERARKLRTGGRYLEWKGTSAGIAGNYFNRLISITSPSLLGGWRLRRHPEGEALYSTQTRKSGTPKGGLRPRYEVQKVSQKLPIVSGMRVRVRRRRRRRPQSTSAPVENLVIF